MLLASVLLAAALPLGVWPEESGPPALVVADVPIFVAEPEDDYWIVAVTPLLPPTRIDNGNAMAELARLALRLGADAVLLLEESPTDAIPEDPEAPLPTTGKFAAAVFLVFDVGEGEEEPPVQRVTAPAPAAGRARMASRAAVPGSARFAGDSRTSRRPLTAER